MEQNQKIVELEAKLKEAITADQFLDSNTGKLWMEVASTEVASAIKDITSDKYEKDHVGYIKRLADLQSYQRIMKKMTQLASPERRKKIKEAIADERELDK